MSTLAVLEFSASHLGLEEAFEVVPEMTAQAERSVGEADGPMLSHVLFSNVSREELETALASDASIADARYRQTADERLLYELAFDTGHQALAPDVLESNEGTILAATGTRGRWELRVRFPKREYFSQAMETCAEYGVEPTLKSVCNPSSGSDSQSGLTKTQIESLEVAHEMGYFEVPREATLDDVAERLDISHQALSECLRRAHNTLVSAELAGRDGHQIGDDGTDRTDGPQRGEEPADASASDATPESDPPERIVSHGRNVTTTPD